MKLTHKNKIMKNKIFKLAFTLFVALLSFSCSNDNSSNTINQYQGTWSGIYTGAEDNGTWTAVVNSSGIATGTTTSTTFSSTYELNGAVNMEGVFAATVGSSTSGASFNGIMLANGTASGTWLNNSAQMNGTWTGSKQ